MLRATKEALAETRLGVHDIELVRIDETVDIGLYRPALELGAELGARQVICSIWTTNLGIATERFCELCDLAKPLGLTINLEFVTWADVTNLREAMDILRAADRENVGILVDMLHFHRSCVGLDELAAVPRKWFTFAHLCDAPKEIPSSREELIRTGRAERLYVGEGAIDIASILSRMPEVPYSIELPHLERIGRIGYEEHALRCIESAKLYFESHTEIPPSTPVGGNQLIDRQLMRDLG